MNRKRLKRLVEVRRRIRDAHKSVVAAAGAWLAEADGAVEQELSHQADQTRRLSELDTTPATELAGEAGLVAASRERVLQARVQREQIAEQYELLRGALVEAAHDVKRMEILEERAVEAHRKAVRDREQRELDEVAARMGRHR